LRGIDLRRRGPRRMKLEGIVFVLFEFVFYGGSAGWGVSILFMRGRRMLRKLKVGNNES
jgi:hypothetical protein